MGLQHHHPKASESSEHHHPHAPPHTRGSMRRSEKSRLVWVMVLTGVTMVAELVGGFLTRSVSLLSDAFHMLTHFGAIGLSFVAIIVALRPAAPDKTFRNWRYEVIASLFNGMLLIPIAGYILYESLYRLGTPVVIRVEPMLVVAVVGLVVNLVCAGVLHHHSRHDMNIRGAFVHMLADALSSVGVLAAGVLIWIGGPKFTWADPAAAALISVMILVWSISLIRGSLRILVEAAPAHIDLDAVRDAMKRVEDVGDVHDLHIWTITSKMYAMTAHVHLKRDMSVADTEQLGGRLRELLDHDFDINHATLQFEIHETEALHCEHDHAPHH